MKERFCMGAILINAGAISPGTIKPVIKSQNKIIYTVVDVLNLYSLKIVKISKINHMRRSIETCKPKIIVTTDFPVINVCVTEFLVVKIHVMNYRLLEFGSINCVRYCPQT